MANNQVQRYGKPLVPSSSFSQLLQQYSLPPAATPQYAGDAKFAEVADLYARDYLQRLVKLLLSLENGNPSLHVGYNLDLEPGKWVMWIENLRNGITQDTFQLIHSLPSNVHNWAPIMTTRFENDILWIHLRPPQNDTPPPPAPPPLLLAPPLPPTAQHSLVPYRSHPMSSSDSYSSDEDRERRRRSRTRDASPKKRSNSVLKSVGRMVLGIEEAEQRTRRSRSRK